MARYFTWCLKRTFLLTNRLKVLEQPVTLLKINNHAFQKRYMESSSNNQINLDCDEPKDFSEYMQDSKPCSIHAVPTLMKILSVTKASAQKAIHDYPKFRQLPKRTIYNNFQALREGGFYKSTIKDNKYLLTDDTDVLRQKINIMEKIDVDINHTAPLFHLSVRELAHFEKLSKMETSLLPCRNRLVYLAEKLQCDVTKISHIMSYHPELLRLAAPKLLTITEYLLDAGIAPEHILTDICVYSYSIITIKAKVERAKEVGVKPLRPWVLRCQEDTWKLLEKRKLERESILKPGESVVEYISKVFDCDMESVNYMLEKYPRILSMDLVKLSNIVNLLRREGYQIEDLQRTPTIMSRKYSSLLERIDAWKKMCRRLPPLSVFIYSEDNFKATLLKTYSCRVAEKST